MRTPGKRPRRAAGFAAAFAVAVSGLAVVGVGAGNAATVVVKPPKGAAEPVAATGIGTRAAMENPRCNTGENYGVYGRWDSASTGGGPICVVPFEDGADNGGATSPGVKKDSIKLVAVLPTPQRAEQQALAAQLNNLATGARGTWEDAIHDYLVAMLPYYETWGRDVDVSFYTSTGIDEASQRADAVAIQEMKPFAVINFDSFGLDTLLASLSQAKILTEAFSVSPEESARQAPYRWGGNDPDAAALASAEVIGKNLVGKKAQYAGDDLQGTTRKFGLVMIKDVIDEGRFKDSLVQYKGSIASTNSYVGSGGALGDPTVAQEQAPILVTRMKDAGITTVILFADVAMMKALQEQATAQDWFPEWFHRRRLLRPTRARAAVPRRPGRAHLRDLADRPVLRPARRRDRDHRHHRRVQLVLRAEPRHDERRGARWCQLVPRRNPQRRTEPDAEDVQAGAVRGTGDGEPEQQPADPAHGVRQDHRAPLRRVQPGAGQLRADVDGPAHARHLTGERHRGGSRLVVHGRRPPLRPREVAEEPEVVRQVELDRPDPRAASRHDAPDRRAAVRAGGVPVDRGVPADRGDTGTLGVRRRAHLERVRRVVGVPCSPVLGPRRCPGPPPAEGGTWEHRGSARAAPRASSPHSSSRGRALSSSAPHRVRQARPSS
jgi:hypothetical protein